MTREKILEKIGGCHALASAFAAATIKPEAFLPPDVEKIADLIEEIIAEDAKELREHIECIEFAADEPFLVANLVDGAAGYQSLKSAAYQVKAVISEARDKGLLS